MTENCPRLVSQTILLTKGNQRKLRRILENVSEDESPESGIQLVAEKLRLANVVSSRVPRNFVTMGSTVSIIDLKTSEKLKFSIVYPDEVNFVKGRVSVLSPLGASILGHQVGDQPDWGMQEEIGRIVIAKVDAQPEASRSPRFASA